MAAKRFFLIWYVFCRKQSHSFFGVEEEKKLNFYIYPYENRLYGNAGICGLFFEASQGM